MQQFEQAVESIRELLSSTPLDFFSSGQDQVQVDAARPALAFLEPICERVLSVFQADEDGSELGFPGLDSIIAPALRVYKSPEAAPVRSPDFKLS